MNFKQIQQLIKFVARTGVSEVNIENSNIKINIKGNNKDSDQPQVIQQPIIAQPQIPVQQPVEQPKPIQLNHLIKEQILIILILSQSSLLL